MAVARASAIGGAAGTSLVEAGRRYGLALSGTMAHSYVMAHELEETPSAYLRQYGAASILLVDTYDTTEGVHGRWPPCGPKGGGAGVRIDSGDLAALAVAARHPRRRRLRRVQVLASGTSTRTASPRW